MQERDWDPRLDPRPDSILNAGKRERDSLSLPRLRRRVHSFFGGEVHFELERTLCQKSLKYIYLCIIRKVHPFLAKKEKLSCVIKIRNIILTITHCWPGTNGIECQRRNYIRVVRGMPPGKF